MDVGDVENRAASFFFISADDSSDICTYAGLVYPFYTVGSEGGRL